MHCTYIVVLISVGNFHSPGHKISWRTIGNFCPQGNGISRWIVGNFRSPGHRISISSVCELLKLTACRNSLTDIHTRHAEWVKHTAIEMYKHTNKKVYTNKTRIQTILFSMPERLITSGRKNIPVAGSERELNYLMDDCCYPENQQHCTQQTPTSQLQLYLQLSCSRYTSVRGALGSSTWKWPFVGREWCRNRSWLPGLRKAGWR